MGPSPHTPPELAATLFAVARVRSVADILRAQQSDDELRSLAEQYRAEIARIQHDLDTVEAALGPPTRRSNSRTVRSSNGSATNGVKRDDVLKAIVQQGHPVTAPEIRQILESMGYSIRTEAVRTHFMRLVKDRRLVALGEGRYAVSNAASIGGGILDLGIEAPEPSGTLDLK